MPMSIINKREGGEGKGKADKKKRKGKQKVNHENSQICTFADEIVAKLRSLLNLSSHTSVRNPEKLAKLRPRRNAGFGRGQSAVLLPDMLSGSRRPIARDICRHRILR
jgi:hypothetical protein